MKQKTIKIPLKEYNHLKKTVNSEAKHNRKRCYYCREWYAGCMKNLKYIQDKKMRYDLKHLIETLWINNCSGFDIIYYEFFRRLR